MSKLTVLITSAGNKVSLVQAFHQHFHVIAVDASPFSAALHFADEAYLVPGDWHPQYLDTLVTICRTKGVDLLVPTRDEELPFFAANAWQFAIEKTTVMVADVDTIRICQDKREFVDFCRDTGYPTPITYTGVPPIFPVFARPRRGKGGMGARRVECREELIGVGDDLVQEFIDAPEYTVDLFADFEGKVISAVPRTRVIVENGESKVGRTTRVPIITDACVSLARTLGLIGHNTLQVFLHHDEPKFIEVNPRYGGGAPLGFQAGIDTPWLLAQLLRGETLDPKLDAFQTGIKMLRYSQDLFLGPGDRSVTHWRNG